ncbi:NAD(P)-binding protein, partial [Salarchaeum japonicum]
MSDTPTVGIVGGGVAGLTAATFTARADLETTVFDAG